MSQLKQGALESVRKYKERTMTLQNKFQGCLKAQDHEGTDLIFAGINALEMTRKRSTIIKLVMQTHIVNLSPLHLENLGRC